MIGQMAHKKYNLKTEPTYDTYNQSNLTQHNTHGHISLRAIKRITIHIANIIVYKRERIAHIFICPRKMTTYES